MKKIISIVAIAMALVLGIVGLTACGNKTVDETEVTTEAVNTAKVYKIVADNSFAPFEFADEANGGYTGIDMDLMAAIAEDQGFEYTMDNCGWDASLANLGSGQADAMIAGMTITEERQETYDFTDAYFEDGQTLFTVKGSDITTLEDLAGKKVAVKTGTMGAEYANSICDEYGFTVETFEGSDEVYQAVIAGNVDAGTEDFSVISYKIENSGLDLQLLGEKVNVKPYGVAVQKGMNAEFVQMFNAGLANIKANGVYDEILAKYGM